MYGQAFRHRSKRSFGDTLLPRELERYPRNIAADFRSCEPSTLRKYLSHFEVDAGNDMSKASMARAVAMHYQKDYDVSEEKVICEFARFISEYGDDPNNKRSKKRHGTRGSTRASVGSEDEEEDSSPQPLYCICNQVSYGEMIGCDNDDCKIEWFHVGCVGIKPSQLKGREWYCRDCRPLMEQKEELEQGISAVKRERIRQNASQIEVKDPEEEDEENALLGDKHDEVAIHASELETGDEDSRSMTYSQMITEALLELPDRSGTFKEICDRMEKAHGTSLNWKPESEIRKSPVWKSSVRKILLSNSRFRKATENVYCLVDN